MKNIFFLFCALILFAFSTARANAFQVKVIKAGFHADNLRIPYVLSENMELAMRINDYIYLDIVEDTAPEKWVKYLKISEEHAGMIDLNYKVIRNDDKILSIKVNGMSCGASCWPVERYFNFDANMVGTWDFMTY